MNYRLVILGLLAEEARHGYEIKQMIEVRNMAPYLRLSGGGLYYQLRKLREEGYIAEQNVEKDGPHPDRHIFSLTPTGQQYLNELLRQTLEDVAGRRHYDPLDMALVFGGSLPPSQVAARLSYQLDQLRPELVKLTATYEHFLGLGERVDPYAQLILEKHLDRLRGDIAWLEEAVRRLEHDPAFRQAAQGHWQHELVTPDPTDQNAAYPYSGWETFEERLRQARAGYQRELTAAWQDYDQALATHNELVEARRIYHERVKLAWEQYLAVSESRPD